MLVLFGFSGDLKKTAKVFFVDNDGLVRYRYMRPDGTVTLRETGLKTLEDVARDHANRMSPLYPAEVGDVRSAFKYIGKSADLVDLLPEAPFTPSMKE